ncbi:hypothetical protein [Actinomadura flavalba]|uniref:hypothetical protein n=1 Tax=Actinomadura flavalba TaxID=1120938 RepID=UPI00047782F6|nr:hypothetical protein [Actinomadura flavalba]
MSDDTRPSAAEADGAGRWTSLPPHTPLSELTTGQEVPPSPQVIREGGPTAVDEATQSGG